MNGNYEENQICHRVIKNDSGLYIVDVKGRSILCKSRKRNKADSILVGDRVLLQQAGEEYVISEICKRNNQLIRPAIANIDQIIIVIAQSPEADLVMVDKLIINCIRENIETVLCINKTDLGQGLYEDVVKQYSGAVDALIVCSAINDELDQVKKLLPEKLTCFAGQSAVGKSTIVNRLLSRPQQRVGALSEKTKRGKNTTTGAQLFAAEGGYIIDTPGFSLLELGEMEPEEICLYYEEYVRLSPQCKYHHCTHTAEPECAVRAAAGQGEISQSRYQRYLKIFEEIKLRKQNAFLRKVKYENFRKTQN